MPRILPILLLALSLVASTGVPVARADPDRSGPQITFTGDTIALVVGYGWGDGTLWFEGRPFSFTATGVTLVGAGADRIKGVAQVRNLRRVEDFEGLYALVGASGTFITLGGGRAVLRNAKGVEIHLRAQSQGLRLGLGGGGVNIKLG